MKEEKFGFQVSITNITRDWSQGNYGNRIPLDDNNIGEGFAEWEKLVHTKGKVVFNSIEVGGAQPQVDTVFRNQNFLEVIKAVREKAPNATIRPLWRGANGFMLKPHAPEELGYILKTLAEETSPSNTTSKNPELLCIKVFDSQGIVPEMEETVKIVASLREQGHPVGIELAIPYSNGETLGEDNPYTDEFYVNKFIAAAKLAKKYGIPQAHFRLSLKDMVGELNAENAKRLVGKIIDALKENNFQMELGLHLHDTGLATEAYKAAIEVCKEKNWPVAIDTVEGKNTGFVRTLTLNETIDLGLTEEQINHLQTIEEYNDKAAEAYKVCKVEGTLSGEQLRKFRIPGGGLASFETAVKISGLAEKLGVSQEEMFVITGDAMVRAWYLMGKPFAVTPGFKNMQDAAINLLTNMVEKGILTKEMQTTEIQEILSKELNDEQVETLFLHNLNNVVKGFLTGEMPAEVHPVIRKTLKKRETLWTDDVPSQLKEYKEVVKELQKKEIIDKGDEAFKRGVSQAIMTGNPEVFRKNMERKEWYREPDPKLFDNKEEYERRLELFRKALDPRPDSLEKIRISYLAGDIDTRKANKYTETLLKAEREAVKLSVIETLKQYNITALAEDGKNCLSGKFTSTLEDAVKRVYNTQKELINKLASEGKQYLYPEQERLRIALDYLVDTVTELAKELDLNTEETTLRNAVKKEVQQCKEEIESISITAKTPGKMVKIFVKEGDEVKKGDKLFAIEIQKMENEFRAAKDCTIDTICVKENDVVNTGDTIITFKKEEKITLSSNEINTIENDKAVFAFKQREEKIQKSAKLTTLKKAQTEKKLEEYQLGKLNPESGQGYHGIKEAKKHSETLKQDKAIHVIGNRGGCAVKLKGDLLRYGAKDVRVLYTKDDDTTPVIKNSKKEEKIPANSYTDQAEILKILKQLSEENPKKTIIFHPGWGFLSEKDDFVQKLEKESKDSNIIFAGPSSEPMKEAGGKKTFRDLVQDVAKDCNPEYVGGITTAAETLQKYIESGFQNNGEHKQLDSAYRYVFKQVMKMGGDVVMKAVAGGGGRGIAYFQYDNEKTEEKNYQSFIRVLAKNIATSEKLFGDGEMLIEQRVQGKTHHVEVQFATGNGEAVTLGLRNCTAQLKGQKYIESNIIVGDYPNELAEKIIKSAQAVAKRLAEKGYEGVGTLEMLVNPETQKVTFLEVNTRVQVEHPVTEHDILLKTGKDISLPVLNALLTSEEEKKTPKAVLEETFGITENDLQVINKLDKERVVHFRINSKHVDVINGEATPSCFSDDKWPYKAVAKIAEECKVTIIQGGLGKGRDCDPQIGAVYGKADDVQKAVKSLQEVFRLTSCFDHVLDTTNLAFSEVMVDMVFDKKNGKVNYNFTTKTTDDMLEDIKKGKASPMQSGQEPLWPGESCVDPERISQYVNKGEEKVVHGKFSLSFVQGKNTSKILELN